MVYVPPESVGGAENVLAVCAASIKREAAAESSDALVLRLPDAAAAAELRRCMVQSASQMAAVAGLLKVRWHLDLCLMQRVLLTNYLCA